MVPTMSRPSPRTLSICTRISFTDAISSECIWYAFRRDLATASSSSKQHPRVVLSQPIELLADHDLTPSDVWTPQVRWGEEANFLFEFARRSRVPTLTCHSLVGRRRGFRRILTCLEVMLDDVQSR